MLVSPVSKLEIPRAWFVGAVFGFMHFILSIYLLLRFTDAAEAPIGSTGWQLIPAAIVLFPMWLLGLVGLFTLSGYALLLPLLVLLPLNSALWSFVLVRFLPRVRGPQMTLRGILVAMVFMCAEFAGLSALNYWEVHRHDFGPDPNSVDGRERPWRRGNMEFTPQSAKKGHD